MQHIEELQADLGLILNIYQAIQIKNLLINACKYVRSKSDH